MLQVDIENLEKFHYIYKLCSTILSKPTGSSVALKARETYKMTKKFPKT